MSQRYARVTVGKALYRLDLKFTPYRRELVRVGRSIRMATFVFGVCVAMSAR